MYHDKKGETFVSDCRSKLYEMVDDHSTDSIVSWSESGKSFIVWDEVEFRRALRLPGGCLGYLGFSQSQSHEQCEYACPYFMRGQPDLKPSRDKIETDNKVYIFFSVLFFCRCFFCFVYNFNMALCLLIRAWTVAMMDLFDLAAFLATKRWLGLPGRSVPLPHQFDALFPFSSEVCTIWWMILQLIQLSRGVRAARASSFGMKLSFSEMFFLVAYPSITKI